MRDAAVLLTLLAAPGIAQLTVPITATADNVKQLSVDELAVMEQGVQDYIDKFLKDSMNGSIEKVNGLMTNYLQEKKPQLYKLISSFGQATFHVDKVATTGSLYSGYGSDLTFSGSIGTGEKQLKAGYNTKMGDSFSISADGKGGATLKFVGTMSFTIKVTSVMKGCISFSVNDRTTFTPDFSFNSPELNLHVADAGALTDMVNQITAAVSDSFTDLFQPDGEFTVAINDAMKGGFTAAIKDAVGTKKKCVLG